MKKIKLPIGYRLSMKIDPQKAFGLNINRAEPIASIKINSEALGIAQENGAQVVYAASTIERKMETVILHYFFGPTVGIPKPEKELFDSEVLQSDRVTYSFKKQILQKILDKCNFLSPQDKDGLQKSLSKIMRWRNAFAHGQLVQRESENFSLNFYSNGNQNVSLDDNFWTEVEDCFNEAQRLLAELEEKFSAWLIKRDISG